MGHRLTSRYANRTTVKTTTNNANKRTKKDGNFPNLDRLNAALSALTNVPPMMNKCEIQTAPLWQWVIPKTLTLYSP